MYTEDLLSWHQNRGNKMASIIGIYRGTASIISNYDFYDNNIEQIKTMLKKTLEDTDKMWAEMQAE